MIVHRLPHGKTAATVLIITAALLGAVAVGYTYFRDGGGACSQERRTCADGTGVGRVGLRCEFQRCPDGSEAVSGAGLPPSGVPSEPVVCTMEAKLCPDGSYVGRTGPNCEFAPCPATPSEGSQAPAPNASQPPTTKLQFQGTRLAGSTAPLLNFTKTDYDATRSSGKLVVLYFYANWCPICRAEFPTMQTAFNELTTDNVVGFRVNFNDSDTDADEVDVARQFGVAYQHTKVFLKGDQRVLKSPETWEKERYLQEIATYR